MPLVKMALAKAKPFTAEQKARFAAMEADDSSIDFSDQEEITPEKLAAGHYRIVGRGGVRSGAGRKSTGNRPVKPQLPLRPSAE